jgi:hypothetical protein
MLSTTHARFVLRAPYAQVRTKALHLARHLVTLNMSHMAAGVEAGYIVAAAAALAVGKYV